MIEMGNWNVDHDHHNDVLTGLGKVERFACRLASITKDKFYVMKIKI
jgi:hypothetical protein